jgi:hypothetical protein
MGTGRVGSGIVDIPEEDEGEGESEGVVMMAIGSVERWNLESRMRRGRGQHDHAHSSTYLQSTLTVSPSSVHYS